MALENKENSVKVESILFFSNRFIRVYISIGDYFFSCCRETEEVI